MISVPENTAKSEEIISRLTTENKNLRHENLYLQQELKQLKKMIFGSKRERFEPESPNLQLGLFAETEEETKVEPEKEEISYIRNKKKKKKPVRTALPEHLPRREEIIEPENLPENARKIGEAVSEVLEYEPGIVYVRKIVRPKYIIPETEKIVVADMPSLPLPYANAGASLLTLLIVSKYVDHLPFYRQVKMLKRHGITLAESTVNDWFVNTCKLLEPLYEVLKKEVLQSSYIQADETPIKVLTSAKKNSSHKGYFWVYHSPPDGLVCFDYQKGRSRSGPKDFLQDFKGVLQTDGYGAYDSFGESEDITLAACMAHARRKFSDAKDGYPEVSEHVLGEMQKLYAVERIAKENEYSSEQIKNERREKSLPVFTNLMKYMKKQLTEVLPKSAAGKAVAYTLRLKDRLGVYLDKPEVLIDNNLVENTIRPVALGRKNYLFAGSHEAAQRAAMIYSFFGSCKLNNIDPQQWLKSTLEKIPEHKVSKLKELLPGY